MSTHQSAQPVSDRPSAPRSRSVAWLVAALLALTLWIGAPVRAEGQAAAMSRPDPSPQFRQAARVWLDGPESQALADLAMLAQSGDAAARLLLGLIDKTPALQGPWLSRLPRADRLALMRAPGGLSGRSWLTIEGGHPVAAAWQALHGVDADLDTAAWMASLGEARAAREAVLVLAARDRLTLDPNWTWPDWMDLELAYVVWPRAENGLREVLELTVPETHPQRGLMGLTVADDALTHWLVFSDAARPLRAICDTTCPQTRVACLRAAYHALGSHNAVLTLGSPTESLIAGDDFLAARRGRMAVLRRILLTTDARGRRAQIASARETDACLADLLHAEADRYRYIREGSEGPPADD